MRRISNVSTILLLSGLVSGVALFSAAYAKKPGGGGGGGDKCPRDILCADIWDPVICDDGQVYSNSCYAFQQCATGCVPYDDGGPITVTSAISECPRNISCPDVWNPVICNDGQIYSNKCYARMYCATGCVSYDDGIIAANAKKGGFWPCGGFGIECLDVWDPVVCDDGQTYSNLCYAHRACATGCEPLGDVVTAAGGGSKCPRDMSCPDVYDPVECSDGQVYSNKCYAFVYCATGCHSYDDGGAVAGGRIGGGFWGCGGDILCLDVWDPVICDNGQVYSNSCYALKACATGCGPLNQ